MDDLIPPLAQDMIKKLLVKNPKERLGAIRVDDLLTHPLFEGVNFSTIKDESPPMELELTKYQLVLKKFLPQNIQKRKQKQQEQQASED